jgi:uncharacterized membrane protein
MKSIIVAAITMLLLDSVYLKSMSGYYGEQIEKVQRTVMKIKPEGVVACYLFLVFGLYYFILRENRPITDAIILGIIIYGVYDATTYAVLKDWSPFLAISDTIWGGILFGLTSYVTYAIM